MPKREFITFVCTANICRSPMAEALLKHALDAEPEPLRSLKVISAGIAADDGDSVSENAVRAMKKVDIDVSEHKSQTLTEEIVSKSQAIFCMTHSHLAIIETLFEGCAQNVFLMRELLAQEKDKDEDAGYYLDQDFRVIPDPYGSPLASYIACRDSMVEAISPIINWLRENYKED